MLHERKKLKSLILKVFSFFAVLKNILYHQKKMFLSSFSGYF